MPVRRHGKTWEARVQFGGRRLSRSFANRRDAFEWERRTRGRLEDSRVGRTPGYSLEEALHRWLTGEAAVLRCGAEPRGDATWTNDWWNVTCMKCLGLIRADDKLPATMRAALGK